jgi:3-hydroxybutyrate dehydrogenase
MWQKHGLVGLTKAAALEHAAQGVTVNALCPGWVLTPLVQAQVQARAAAGSQSTEQATAALLAEKEPSGKFTATEDVGALAVFLASSAADNVMGAAWVCDGGWTAQ